MNPTALTDPIEPSPQPSATAKPAPRQLTRRATLSLAANLLRQSSQALTQMVVTPILINGLGVPLFGAWTMIQQFVRYMGLGEVRPVSTLKFTLAVRQHEEDHEPKRRLVGAALRLTYLGIPALLIVGAVLTWMAPSLIRVGPEYVWGLRVAMAIAVVHFIGNRLLLLPSNVLVGMNLDYRAMGLGAGSAVLGGALTVLAIHVGAGLPGVAAATAIGTFAYGIGRYIVARRALSWFGASRPSREELISFAKVGFWVAVSGVGNKLLTSSDAILLGLTLGPAVAAVYATTGAVLRLAAAPMAGTLASGSAGLSDLCGRREWPSLMRVRAEMHLVTIAVMSVVGFVTIALNRHFLLVWTRRDIYAGSLANVILVSLTMAVLLYRTERVITMSLLEFKRQTLTVTVCGILSLSLGTAGAYWLHPASVPAAAVLAYVLILVVLGRIIRKTAGPPPKAARVLLLRPFVTAVALWSSALLIETRIAPRSWPQLFLYAVPLTAVAVAVTAFVGMGPLQRRVVTERLRRAITTVRNRSRRAAAVPQSPDE